MAAMLQFLGSIAVSGQIPRRADGEISGALVGSLDPPATVLWDGKLLAGVQMAIRSGSPPTRIKRAAAALSKKAEESMNVGPLSVMNKPLVPPSGDKHDYLSTGSYWSVLSVSLCQPPASFCLRNKGISWK